MDYSLCCALSLSHLLSVVSCYQQKKVKEREGVMHVGQMLRVSVMGAT